MTAKRTLLELMQSGSVLAPCVFDCSSARAVELAGFEAMLLSGSEVSMSMKGIPDLGLLSLEELLWAVERIVDMSPLPLAVDIEDGFGASPLQVYETCRRVAKAGAMAVLMEDEFEPGYARDVSTDNLIPREEYYAKVRAAVKAVEGTDCMVIARSNYGSANLEEGIQRMIDCVALGAHATVVVNVTTLADAAEVARRVPGLKMFADINAKRGLEQMSFAQLAELGFQLVTMHFTMKASGGEKQEIDGIAEDRNAKQKPHTVTRQHEIDRSREENADENREYRFHQSRSLSSSASAMEVKPPTTTR